MSKAIRTEPKNRRITWLQVKKFLMGTAQNSGFIFQAVRYIMLTTIAFVFMYPLLYMLSRSMMSSNDLMDATTRWLPTSLQVKNYQHAVVVMDYWNSLKKTLMLCGIPSLLQVIISCVVGYGFACYQFPLKKWWLGVLLLNYLLPASTTAVPNYMLFMDLGIVDGSLKPFLLTSVLGQGINSTLCILIFYSFHRQVPRVLLEAAEIDGAGPWRTFFSVALPRALAGIVVVTLFSFVWYWNETYLINTYLGYGHNRHKGMTTLIIELNNFDQAYNESVYSTSSSSGDKLNDAYRMAGTAMTMLPLLLLYLVLQRQFVESIDNAGITGE